jgi:signal recognition particle subunit SRP54
MIGILTEKLTSTLSRLFGKSTKTDRAQILSELTNTLLDSDVPRTIAEQFIIEIEKELSTERKGSLSEKEWVISTLYKQLVHFLTAPEKISFNAPGRILMIGTQGGGKTTTVAKLGHHLTIKHRVLCASVDFQRPAAIDQLEQMANTGGIDFYRAKTESPEAAAKEITAHAEKEGYDWLLLDTAGRLDTEENLIKEVQTVKKILQPTHTILVLDGMLGQASLTMSRAFNDRVGFDGVILTKMDGAQAGGAAFSCAYALKKPLVFLGSGERIDDLEKSNPERLARRILGHGDLEALLERSEQKIKQDELARVQERLLSGKITLNDLAQQIELIGSMGSLGKVLSYLPLGGARPSSTDLARGEREMRQSLAIIRSMTRKERAKPQLLDNSRKDRVARGAGVARAEVEALIGRFEEMKRFGTLLKKSGPFRTLFKGI